MSWLLLAAIATASSVSILMLVNTYLYVYYRERFMKIWAIAWGIYILRYLCLIVALLWRPTYFTSTLYYVCIIACAVLLFNGTRQFIGKPPVKWFAPTGVLLALWAIVFPFFHLPVLGIIIPVFTFLSLTSIFIGRQILKQAKRDETAGHIVGWLFIVWGVHQADYPLLRPIEWLAPWGFLFGAALALSIAIGMVLIYFERTHKILLEKEERHRNLIESSHDWIWEIDTNNTFTYASPLVRQRLGYTPEEVLGKTPFDLMPEAEATRIRGIFADISSRREPFHGLENVNRHKDGRLIVLETSGVPFFDTQGNYRGYRGMDQDVTERKRVEAELRESAQRHQSIIKAAIDGFILIDEDGRLREVNDSYCRMSGYSEQELLAMSVSDLECRETPAEIAARTRRITDEKGHDRFESQHRRRDGDILDVEISIQFRPSADGLFVAFVRDITGRKRIEAALVEREYFFRESQKAAFIGSYKADFITGVWESSEVLDTIFGIGKDYERTIPGWLDIIHPDDRSLMDRYLMEEVLSNQQTFSNEYRIIRVNDGATRWVHGAGELHVDSGGNVTSMIGTIRDITDQRLAFEQLKNISQRLQLATASANLGVWDWNLRENHMEWDDRMFEIYGIASDAFVNGVDAWMSGLHPEDRDAAVAACRSAWNGEQVFDTTFRICRPDGSVRHIKANGLVLRGTGGAPERLIGVNADISATVSAEEERARLEAQLQQAQKMESVGRLAGGIAHDFNNLLTVILGRAQLALMGAGHAQPLHDNLEEIIKAGERSADLTRQLLAFARKQTVAPALLDLNRTLSGMLKMLQRLIGEDINLDWRPAADLWPVNMDPSQIDQVLVNLCVNARDAITDIGKITIETANVVCDKLDSGHHENMVPGEYVLLAVSDDGCGMGTEMLSHIFEPFFTTTGVGEGTGLGLATVYGIVRQNNGFIDVYSEPGHGTTFRIYLPRHHDGPMPARAESGQVLLVGGQETILLVEDERAILEIAETMLKMQGYTVLAAHTTDEAIRLAQEHAGEIHLLITDVIMPLMNGRDLAKILRTFHPRSKCLFMSGYTADVIAHNGVLDGGVYFIQKPFSMQNLATKVREALDGAVPEEHDGADTD